MGLLITMYGEKVKTTKCSIFKKIFENGLKDGFFGLWFKWTLQLQEIEDTVFKHSRVVKILIVIKWTH